MGRSLLPAVIILLAAATPLRASEESGCLLCHRYPLSRQGDAATILFGIDPAARKDTAHAGLGCRACHPWVTVVPHGPGPAATDCTLPCHLRGPEGKEVSHAEIAAAWTGSAHKATGAAALSCRGCHRLEGMEKRSGYLGGSAWCLPCHGVSDSGRWLSYLSSPHGRALASGAPGSAECPDCHTVHDVRGSADPRSSIHPRNRTETCRGALSPRKPCHPDATEGLAAIGGHVAPDREADRLFPTVRRAGMAAIALFLIGGILGIAPRGGGGE